MPPELLAAVRRSLEDALEAMGVTVWPMVEYEADDAMAAAAAIAAADDARRPGDHLHPRQGPRPVRRRHSGRAVRPAQEPRDRRGRRAREVRRRARVDPRLPRARRRHRRRLPRPARVGAPRPRRPCSPATSTSRTSRRQAGQWDVPGLRHVPRAGRDARRELRARAAVPAHRHRRVRRRTSAPSTSGDGPGPTSRFAETCEKLGTKSLHGRAMRPQRAGSSRVLPQPGLRLHDRVVRADGRPGHRADRAEPNRRCRSGRPVPIRPPTSPAP